ncbi:MAG: ABC transporter permease [Chloroflexota bacterium]
MLSEILSDQVRLGLTQAALASLLALAVVWMAGWRGVHIERESVVALARGLIQVVLVGAVLVVMLQGPTWTSILILVAMMVAAAETSARRARKLSGAFWDTLWGLAFGSGVVILLMTALGVIEMSVASLVPVGSMIIANAMNSAALALDRFRAEVESHTGQIEAGLALGADPKVVVVPYVRSAVQASLIPRIDNLRTLGIVWIPGLMAGMILSGSDPVYAAIYQFVVLAMIFAAGGLTSVATLMLLRTRAFSSAAQLTLRSGGGSSAR